MTTAVTVDQLRNLTDRAATGLTPDEQQRLRDGIDRLAALLDAESRTLAEVDQRCDRYAAQLAGVRALRDRWVKAGPPPLGTSISRWWDKRLAELGAALGEQPGPTATQDRLAPSGIHTPGCDCGHDGMGVSWHGDDCPWRRDVVDCPGRPTPS